MKALHGRKPTILILTVSLAFGALTAMPAVASAGLTLKDARQVAINKVKNMERKLKGEGAKGSSIRGCWREGGRAVGCLGLVSGQDSFLRWRCAVPMTIRKRPAASASAKRIAVKFDNPMCSF